jgi:type I restriction enzyme M protein
MTDIINQPDLPFSRLELDGRLLARMRHEGHLESFVTSVAAFIILRWAERLEIEAEAVAASEGRAYKRLAPAEMSWSSFKSMSPPDLLEFLRHGLWPHLESLSGEGRAEALAGLARAYDPESIKAEWLAEAMLLVGSLADGSISGGPHLAEAFDKLVEYCLDGTDLGGIFVKTPPVIAKLMVELADPLPRERIYDPCYRVGTILAEVGRYLATQGQRRPAVKSFETESRAIYGGEKNSSAYLIGLARVILSGINSPHLALGDTLLRDSAPAFEDCFDCIITNPPLAGSVGKPYLSRWQIEPTTQVENLFLQYVMSSLCPNGRAVVLASEGLMFHSGAAKLREILLTNFRVEGVISLPSGALRPYSNIRSSIIVFRRAKPAHRVWFQVADLDLSAARRRRFPISHDLLGEQAKHLESSGAERSSAESAQEIANQVEIFQSRRPSRHGWFVSVDDLAARGYSLSADQAKADEVAAFIESLREKQADIYITTLGEQAEVFRVAPIHGALRTKTPPTIEDDFPAVRYIRAGDLRDGRVAPSEEYLGKDGLARVRDTHYLKLNDLLVSVSGLIGKVGLVGQDADGAVPSPNLMVLRANRNGAQPIYLLRLLQSAPYRSWFAANSRGSTTRTLTAESLKKLPIPLPPVDLQTRIGFDLPPKADASAMLQSLLADRTTGELYTFLMTDPAISALLNGYETLELRELMHSLRHVAEAFRQWVTGASVGQWANERLTRWMMAVSEAIERLSLAFDVLAAERLFILESLKIEHLSAQIDFITQPALARRMQAIHNAMLRTVESERQQLFSKVEIASRISPAMIEIGRGADLTIFLKNESPVTLAMFTAEVVKASGCSGGGFQQRALRPSEEASLVVSVAPSIAPGEREIKAQWSAQQLDGQPVSGEAVVKLLVREASAEQATPQTVELGGNPYVVGAPIAGGEMFFGRADILDRIKRTLRADGPSTVILLEGNRRTGKTSILKRLQERDYLAGWLPVYYSFQSGEGDGHLAGLPTDEIFYNLARELILATPIDAYPLNVLGLSVVDKSMTRFELRRKLSTLMRAEFQQGNSFEQFLIQLEAVLDAIQPLRIALMLDEFDKIQEGIDNQITSPQLPENLRYLFHTHSRISGILTGSRRIRRLREEYWNVLFGFGVTVTVGPLESQAALDLVTRPVEGRLSFLDGTGKLVIDRCAQQPFLIQSLCHRIFEECADTGERDVTRRRVESAAGHLVESSEHFKTLWDYIDSDFQRYVLCMINRLSRERDLVTFNLLFEQLIQEGFSERSESILGNGLENLVDLELLAPTEQGGEMGYKLAVPLFARWLTNSIDASVWRPRAITELEAIDE